MYYIEMLVGQWILQEHWNVYVAGKIIIIIILWKVF